jgi:hypothetical protein
MHWRVRVRACVLGCSSGKTESAKHLMRYFAFNR